MTRITSPQPYETALQLLAERLQAAIATASEGELVAVLFVKMPSEQAVADQVAANTIANRGVVQEYVSGQHMDALEMVVGSTELD